MKAKRSLSLILALIMILSVAMTASPSNKKPSTLMPQIPEEYSIQYIGKYHEASPVLGGMVAVSSGDVAYTSNPEWGFLNAETGEEVVAPGYVHRGYPDYQWKFSGSMESDADWNRYPIYGEAVSIGFGPSFDRVGKVIVPSDKYDYISKFITG